MKELYFINVVDKLLFVSFIITILAAIACILFGVMYFIAKLDDDCHSATVLLKFCKKMLIVLLICLPINIFVPSKKELYVIYGVGTVIDYVKENPDMKSLPDKTVKTLNKLYDEFLETEKKKTDTQDTDN